MEIIRASIRAIYGIQNQTFFKNPGAPQIVFLPIQSNFTFRSFFHSGQMQHSGHTLHSCQPALGGQSWCENRNVKNDRIEKRQSGHLLHSGCFSGKKYKIYPERANFPECNFCLDF
jgi:hypothetical protein